jgi:hypothetical protein
MQIANNRCRDDAAPPAEEDAGSGSQAVFAVWL